MRNKALNALSSAVLLHQTILMHLSLFVSTRYALICQQCFSHNGMALKEEFEYVGKISDTLLYSLHLHIDVFTMLASYAL